MRAKIYQTVLDLIAGIGVDAALECVGTPTADAAMDDRTAIKSLFRVGSV